MIFFELESTISLYPVPSNTQLHVQLPTNIELVQVEICNSLGQLVAIHTNEHMDISNLSSGVHFAKIVTSQGIFHKNFIKKKKIV